MAMLMQRYQTTVASRGDLPPKQHPIVSIDAQPQRSSLVRRSLRTPAKIAYPTRLSTPPRASVPVSPPQTTTSPLASTPRGRESMRMPGRANGSAHMSVSRYRSSSCAPTAVSAISQDDFRKAFTAVPKTTNYSNLDVRTKLETAKSILSNPNEDWSKRSNQLKLIRSVVLNSDESIDQRMLLPLLNDLSDALELSIRDLRSQVVREAAVTCSFLCENFGMEVKNIAETVFPAALAQVSVSTKIMATSAATLAVFIVQKIQTRQIFNILQELGSSKAKEQRRQLATLLEIIISNWEVRSKHPILRQIAQLTKNAICDADGETRVAGRKAFAKLEQLHGDLADHIFRELDASKQKMLKEGVASSSSSLNSDRDSQKSSTTNISQKFLAQRSASAVDAKQMVLSKIVSKPTTSKLPKSTSTSFSAVKSSGYGQPRSKTPASSQRTSSPSPIQTPIQRVASNLGSTSFVGSLTYEQANNLQQAMDKARIEMNKQNNEDDEILLSNVKSSPRNSPPVLFETSQVEYVLKACCSSNINEKRDAVKQLNGIVGDQNLNESEVKQIGDVLTRLLAEGNTTILLPILETISIFVRFHHEKLSNWLKLALGKLFGKMGTEALPNVKSALSSTQKAFLTSFDPAIQLKAVCDFMCDPVHLLIPKARLALLDYLCLLFEEIWPDDHRCLSRSDPLDTPYTRASVRKMFAWMFDPRSGPSLMEACEKLVCAMFSINAADFTKIFNDLNPECRDWAYRILQLNGEREGIHMSNNNYKEPNYVEEEKLEKKNGYQYNQQQQPVLSTYEARKSTAHLAENAQMQGEYIETQLDNIRRFESAQKVNESMANLHGMMCEGTFTLWNQYFNDLLDAIYQILSILNSEIRKKLALRILTKMCNAQASRLFNSTEVAISKVLNAAITSEDNTMSVAADDCLKTLATHLPLPRIIQVSRRILSQDDESRSMLILKMLTRMFQEIDIDELALILDGVAPCLVQAYESPSSSVRKCAVFGLVALVQRVGMQRMEHHLRILNASKLNIIDLYVGRAKSTESGSGSSNC